MPTERIRAEPPTRAERESGPAATRIRGRRRVHCAYHKCLTVYAGRVFERVARSAGAPPGGYRHFDSRLEDFEREVGRLAFASVNNHAIDLDRFEDVRVTRFVRDPRDLVVSGYFYHRSGAEKWCEVPSPRDEDWRVVNGCVPGRVGPGQSFAGYLRDASLEDGLLAELEFRRRHFESMRCWPDDDPRIRVFRYEDVVGHETAVFDRIFRFFGLSPLTRAVGAVHVRRLRAARRRGRDPHVRDPRPGQWREVFTPAVTRRFEHCWGDLLERLGYADG